MSVGTKYATAFTNGSPISGFKNIGKIAIDTNPGSGDYSLGNFVGGVQASYDDNSYIIISDTTTALVDDRSTGNQTGTASPNQPTYFASKFKTDESFIRMVNRLPARSGQTPFVNTTQASNWLSSNGYWTSFGGIVTNGLTLRLDASNSTSYSGSGSTWIDLADPQQNITLVNSPTYTSASPAYFNFNGSNQYGTGSDVVLGSTSYTKSVWFYLNSYTTNNLVSSSNDGHYMFFNGTNRLYSGHTNWAGFPTTYPSTATFSLNTWYNVALTFNTTDGMKLYINGELDSSYTTIKTGLSGNNSVDIASYANGNLLNGRIARVYCYNVSISVSEVLQNFNTEKELFGFAPPLTIATNAGGGLDGFNVGGQAVAFTILANPAIGTTYSIGSQITFQNGEVRTFVGYDDYGSVYDMFYDSPISTGTLFPITIG